MDRALGQLMPMFLRVNHAGTIIAIGPTLTRLQPPTGFLHRAFFDCFQLQRPRDINSAADLRGAAGETLRLRLAHRPDQPLKAALAPFQDGILMNLSFGIAVQEAVRDFGLTAADFAPTDLSVELLYLIEAKSAAMTASQRLNKRLQGAKIAAEEQAFTDTLTGLKNRRAMDHVLGRITAAGTGFALMHLDLDYFKAVNDAYGHAAGDHVLQHVARILRSETRKGDTIVRFGGDEFVLILEGNEDRATLRAIAKRLIRKLEQPIQFDGETCQISASIGIARSCDYAHADPAQMLIDADQALYLSKRKGRAQHHFHSA